MVSSTYSPRSRGARLITYGSGRETTHARGLLLELDLPRLTLLERLAELAPARLLTTVLLARPAPWGDPRMAAVSVQRRGASRPHVYGSRCGVQAVLAGEVRPALDGRAPRPPTAVT